MRYSETVNLQRNDPCKLCNASWRASCAVIGRYDCFGRRMSLLLARRMLRRLSRAIFHRGVYSDNLTIRLILIWKMHLK